MGRRKGLNQKEMQKSKILQKWKEKMAKIKELVTKNKGKAVAILAGVLTVTTIGMLAMFQSSKNVQTVMSPELAKAMTYPEVQKGDEAVEGTDNVKFDAFFLRDINNDGYAESIRGTSKEIGKEDTLYMELNVQTAGYLKDAKITINGKNFYLQTSLPKDQELQESYIGNNIKELKFNQLNNGTQKLLTGMVRSGDYSYSSSKTQAIGNNINNYSQVNSVTLTGTYVAENGEEIPISKTVEFNIDWYGTTTARINTTSQSKNIDNAINEEEGTISLDFTVYTEETEQKLILQNNHVEGKIPQLNGYAPIEVIYTGTNATFNYNEETRTFTLDRSAVIGEDGTVTSSLGRSNSYGIKAIYPLEAYQELGTESVQIKVPVKTYYEGYNNPSQEFKNPYKSNVPQATIIITYQKPAEQTYNTSIEVKVGKYISQPTWRYVVSKQKPLKLYNGESEKETDDNYTVMWKAFIGTNAKTDGLVMKETQNEQPQVTDQLIKTNAETESVDDVVSNVGIYFTGADTLLGAEGWIKVYDEETGILLGTFTKENWNQYNASNPYRYSIAVKHIRVETSEIVKKETALYVYNIKEIDDEKITTKYTREQFDELQYIKSTLVGYLAGEYAGTSTHQAIYEAPVSIATINISKNTISTQGTEKNDKITIQAQASSANNQVEWLNGNFLVKLPSEIIDVKLNTITINNNNVKLESYEVIEQNNERFIKIITKNNTPQTYTITIDADLTPDPRIGTTTKPIELYASNENGSDYYYKAVDSYDVNNNLNTTEQVNRTTTNISMVSPNSLLTNQIASNYDDKESTVVSPQVADIKPAYAVVDQEKEEQTVKIGVQIKNNYASTISEIQLIGKIPFEGNNYVITGVDLGSTFTTQMTNAGIQVPEELREVAQIYYSENENPDKDLEKEENGWKTAEEIENWDNVKNFLIDLGNYTMPTGKEFIFNYEVKMPNGLEFNQVTYSHHGVYFSLDTENGKYRTQTEPNKLGLRIAEKYDLELTKYQTGKEKVVPGATYSFKEIIKNEDGSETEGETKTGITNSQGILNITNLYAEKIYEIKEIKTPNDYELNSDVVRFIGHVDEHGNLTIEKLEGNPKEEIAVIKNEGENYKAIVKVEDEVKASLKIIKKEQGTENKLAQVRYKLTGYNLAESGKTITTNINGETIIKGLSINEEYTLQEVKAEGYYLANPIKFKIVNQEGNYVIEEIKESEEAENGIASQETIEEDSIPTLIMTLEDEKIPTFDLEISKIKKTTESTASEDQLIAKAETAFAGTEVTYLEGAKFRLYKGTEQIGEYTTDSNGKITITGLYQYETEKDIDQTYTLKEVLAPDGYAKVKDITFKVENIEGELQLQEEVEEGSTEKQYKVEGNTIKLIIEDSPSFRLIKKDKETQTPIANVKFAIYNVDNGETPATNSKGEIIGNKETINGKEYYTVTTNESGEITADLTEGLYKAVEIEAPEQYDLSKATNYFGVGASREGKKSIEAQWAKGIGGSNQDYIESVIETSDGGILVGGYFNSSKIDLGNGVTLSNKGSTSYSDGMVIKYGVDGEVEWAKGIGGSYSDYIKSVIETSDGGYVVGGYFGSRTIDLGNGVTLSNKGSSNGMVIKYSESGECEWAKGIGGDRNDSINSVIETSDGGYVVGGYFQSRTIDLGNGVTLTNQSSSTIYGDGMIIKYSGSGEVEWAKGIGGSGNDYIKSVIETSDGGYVVGGYFQGSTIDLGNGVTLTNQSSSTSYSDGMVIKLSSEGECEWAKGIGGSSNDQVNSVIETADGGYVVGGYFYSSTIDLGNGVTLSNKGSSDGMVIKYSESGECEWAKGIGGSDSEQITTVIETSDGGYLAGGYFGSNIDLGNGVTLISAGNYDGMVVKYSREGECEWAKRIGGTSADYINSVIETADGEILVGGYFGSNIDLGNGVTLSSAGNYDGMLIKYEPTEVPEVVTKQAKGIGGSFSEQINSVIETADGGYVVGGYFDSSEIDLGNGVTLSNKGSTDSSDGMVIKYSVDGEVEWAKGIGGSRNYNEEITTVIETSDGGILVGGYFGSSTIDLGNGVTLRNKGSSDGMVIKYSVDGEVEWAKGIGGSGIYNEEITTVIETSDGGYVVGGDFRSSTIDLGNGVTLINSSTNNYAGMVIKLSSEGECEWAKGIGGSNNDYIKSVIETSDGGILVGGYFGSSTIDLGNGVTLTNQSRDTSYYDGMVIKYGVDGEVEWAKGIGGSSTEQIKSVIETSDGGYVVGGYFGSRTIDLGNGVTLSNKGSSDGMVIKYSESGEFEWAKGIGGSSSDYINSVIETADGGYVVGGHFYSSEIDLGNGVTLTNQSSNTSSSAGMVIKLSSEGECEWAKGIDGSRVEQIKSVIETSDGGILVGGHFTSSTLDLGNGVTLINSSTNNYDGMVIKIKAYMGVPEIQELVVENERKEFRITTDVKEIDGIKGGTISGEDDTPYEKVKYGENSNKEIIMTPDENYEIIAITVNGEEYNFEVNEDGTYTMPQFENMTEDKHIEVIYSLKENKITINKVDSKTKKPLEGATFKLDQIEERTNPENVMGSLTDNGQEYFSANIDNEITDVLGELTSNGTYYFEEQDGTYVPTNGKTYQMNHVEGATTGVQNTTANSYIPIDLTNKEGKYVVVVNARVSSESTDKGYATITENITAPSYSSTTGQIMQIYGTVSAKDYTSTVLEGGKTYYLHLGYRKDSSVDTGEDQIVFNSIKVYGATSETYNFVEIDGKYESNNQGKDNTVANSYIPIDLTDYSGKYNLTVNAQVSSQSSYDYGYATVTSSTTAPAYNTSTGRFIYISGTTGQNAEANDYTTVLQGGQKYYLHLGYYKNASTSSGDDKFTVNSIQVTLNDSELYHTEVTTNSEGQAITQIPFGKYAITEIKAPDGYERNETPIEIEFRADENHEFTIENSEKAKVLVHHYKAIKNEDGSYTYTEEKVAEDERQEGKIDTQYTTSPNLNIEKYELIKDEEENYILPENATGIYISGTTEVIYYYAEKEIPLIVHHYIEGTTLPVPLKDGSEAQDETDKGKEGENYQTQEIEDSLLSDEYELVEVPENANGTYQGSEIEVTYYYQKAERKVVITKIDEKEPTKLLPGVEFTITKIEKTAEANNTTETGDTTVETTETTTKETMETVTEDSTEEKTGTNETTNEMMTKETTAQAIERTQENETKTYTTNDQGKIQITLEVGTYLATEITAPEGYQLPENAQTEFEVTKQNEIIELTIDNQKKQGNVISHYYIEGTTEKVPSNQEGEVVEDRTETGDLGEIYITKEAENVDIAYELVEVVGNTSGEYKEETQEVIYYYQLKTPEIVNSEIDKTTQTEKVTEVNQLIDYTINYQTTINQYRGKATITIVDTLPYEIDEEKSHLAGGNYKSENKTITWTETIEDIDTYKEGSKQIEITKQLSVVYKNIDVTQETIENTVTGTIKLETPEAEETVEDNSEIPTEYLVDIIINKIWNDNEIQAQRRPEGILVQVKNGNTVVAEKEVTSENKVEGKENQWAITVENLPKYDQVGNEMKYIVDETVLEGIEHTEDLKFYTKEITEVKDYQATIRNTFTRPEEKTDITVTKKWEDNHNENSKRPETIVLQLKEGETIVKQETVSLDNVTKIDDDTWNYTFTDVEKYDENGQEISYTVDETVIEGNTHKDDLKFYTKAISGTTITNTFKVPDERISLIANKVWKDNEIQARRRPESIVFVLKQEGEEIARQEITAQNMVMGDQAKWSYTFENLVKYNERGNEIKYTVEELEKTEGDLHFYQTQVGEVTNEVVEGKVTENKTVTITNTFQKPEDKTSVTVNKIWADNNNEAQKRPESIVIQIKNGSTVIREQTITKENKANESITNEENVDSERNWSYTFTELEKYDENGQEIEYTADETEVNQGDLQFYTKTISGTTVTNTFTPNTDKVNVTVTKRWEDNEIQKQRRPESIILQLKRDGEVVESKEVAINQVDNQFEVTFEGVAKYDIYNNIINYTVDETEKTIGDLKFYTKTISGTTITNTFTKPTETISIEVEKQWVDQTDMYRKRPDTITIQLKNGVEVVQEKVISKEDNWAYTFTKVSKYDENGQEINYTIDEKETQEGDLFYYSKEVKEISKGQVNIINTMTKMPAFVEVKYVDINTKEEIDDRTEKEGIVGETFDVTEDKKEIPSYTLVEEPEEKQGTFTEEKQTKTYYYAKNTEVIVKYLEQGTNKILTEEPQYEIDGYEGKPYTTEEKIIDGYTLVETDGKLSGTMEREPIEVIYYYAPNTRVIVKYLEKGTNEELSGQEIITGYVGKNYETEERKIVGYTFVEATDNTQGQMEKDEIEVIYYYAKNTQVIVKHLEKDTNQVLAEEKVIDGYVGENYTTEKENIKNYVFVEATNNTEGTMTEEIIEVIYYYAQSTKATVQHIDRATGEILKQETVTGKVGDLFETKAEDFEGYILVIEPENPDVIMTKEEQIVKYYYAKIAAGVVEKHIDEITKELLYTEEHEGNEGDYYHILSKEFENYDLVTEDKEGNSRLPDNAEGNMTRELIEVKYYYIRRASVRVEYIDQQTGEKLTVDETQQGHQNDDYTTEEKEFKGYKLVETPENATGKMTITKKEDGTYITETVVTYYYSKQAGGVIEKHIDIETNKVLAEQEHQGTIGEKYEILAKEFDGYELVETRLPSNYKGEMAEEKIEVIYYYQKLAKVKVEYIDKQTGEILSQEEIKGHVGDEYETEDKEFDGYELIEIPSNRTGEMKDKEIVVKYYYQRKAEVEIQYLEKDTNYPLAENDTIKGYVGDKYETEKKDIPYYKYIESSSNTKGTMETEKIVVTYYYQKQIFNLSVDKWVSKVSMNGITTGAKDFNTKDELYKLEVHRTKATSADIRVTYTIRVSNQGEIEGTAARITELIPTGYSYYPEDNSIHWEDAGGVLITDELKGTMIQPDEYKEIQIVLRWNPGEENFGVKNNTVIISNLENPANYQDIDKDDNSSKAEMLLAVATGLDRNDRIVIIGIVQIVLAISMGLLVSYRKKEKKK